jgi:hypothetical protein
MAIAPLIPILTAATPFFAEAMKTAPEMVQKASDAVRDVLISRDSKEIHALSSVVDREKQALSAIADLGAQSDLSVQKVAETLQILVNDAGADSKTVLVLDQLLTSGLHHHEQAKLAKRALQLDAKIRQAGIAAAKFQNAVIFVLGPVAAAVGAGLVLLLAGMADNYRRPPTFVEQVRGSRTM